MSPNISEYKNQVHKLIDSIYDVLTNTYGLSNAKRVCPIKRVYGVDADGDYSKLVLTLEDERTTHRITYSTNNNVIILQGSSLLIQQTMVKGGGDYYKLTALVDDLIIVLSKWIDTERHNTTSITETC